MGDGIAMDHFKYEGREDMFRAEGKTLTVLYGGRAYPFDLLTCTWPIHSGYHLIGKELSGF